MSYYLKKHWKISSLVCLLQITTWGLQAGVQLLLMATLDAAIALDFHKFIFWSLLNLGGWGIYMLLCALLGHFQAQAVRTLNNAVRKDICYTLLVNPMAYHSQDTGAYLSWLTADIKQLEKLAWNPFFDCVGRIAHAIWCVIVLATLHWTLLVASLISAVVMWSLPKVFENHMHKLGADCTAQQADAVAKMKDMLSGYDVLRSFGAGKRFLRQGQAVSDDMERPSARMDSHRAATESVVGMASVTIQALSDVLIVALAFRQKIKLAVLMGGSNLIAGVTNGLSMAADLRLSMAASKPYFEKITAHASEQFELPANVAIPVEKCITLENISFSYGEKQVLDHASMHFDVGGKYAIVGPSGCGKSTVLKLLLGWLPEYSGQIAFDGQDAKTIPTEAITSQISYIEQNVFLFNTTIRDNITLGDKFSGEEMEKAIRGSALDGDLQTMPLGLDTPVGENGSNLSGGQKQRVAIARALIHHRSILLVDEGTSALDQKNADIVEKSLLADPDLTLILVSHHLTKARKTQFTKVYEMDNVASNAYGAP